jgi:uncharacterized membrane protein AbrB (regulator of aidB expression)
MSKSVREVLVGELRAPRPLREAMQRWVQRLPPRFRSDVRRFAAAGQVLFGVCVLANLARMTYSSVTTGQPPVGILLGAVLCFAVLVGLLMLLFRWLYPNGFPKDW